VPVALTTAVPLNPGANAILAEAPELVIVPAEEGSIDQL
jgi:hypothetical protein